MVIHRLSWSKNLVRTVKHPANATVEVVAEVFGSRARVRGEFPKEVTKIGRNYFGSG